MISSAPQIQQPQQPLGYGQNASDPMLAQALQSIAAQKQTSPATMSEGLLAQALMQNAMNKRQQQGQTAGSGSVMPSSPAMDLNGLGPAQTPGPAQSAPGAGGGLMGGGGLGSGWMSQLGGLFGLGQAAGGG